MSDKWVLVSGGTGGIGAATVKELASIGFRPAIGYRSKPQAAELLARECGGEAVALDLDNVEQIDAAIVHISERNVEAVVLNAAPPPDIEMFRKTQAQSFEKHFRTCVIGNHHLLSSVIGNLFRKKKAGIVVGVLSSAMGSENEPPLKYASSYIVAEYALQGLLRCAKAEYRWLRIETVSPDFTDTPMLSAFDPRFVDLLRGQGKLGNPQTVAREIVREIITPPSF